MGTEPASAEKIESTRPGGLPPGQHARPDFPRFGTHLHLPPPVAPAEPTLVIAGAVRDERVVTVSELEAVGRREQISDLHCVSGWSATGLRWEGVPFRAFYEAMIEPIADPEASHLVLGGLDGYRIVVDIRDALGEDVLLADRLDGRPLGGDHGGPLRFVSPSQYGYMSAKHLTRIELWTTEPDENFNWVHWSGWPVMRPPFFWRHARSRVWLEERNRHLPARLLRVVYAPLRPPIRWLSGLGSNERKSRDRGRA